MEHEHQNSYIATDSGLFCKECGFLEEYLDMNNFSTQFEALPDDHMNETGLSTEIEQTS